MKTNFYLFLLAFVFFSCSTNDEFIPAEKSEQDVDTNFVDLREAISLATLLEFDIEEPTGLRSTTYLEVEETTPMGSDEKPSYYVVNYANNSGFVIIAADKRAQPVLAYSTENGFDTDMDEMPGGLLDWMASADEYIHDIREGNIEQEASTLRRTLPVLCEALRSTTRAAIPDGCFEYNGSNCPPEYQTTTTYGPLLKTQWHQGAGFNDLVPVISSCNMRAPAGCAAIAIAQVMAYHKYPSSYNWNSINPTWGNGDAPRLIRDLNTSNNLDMKYECGGSSASGEDMSRTFRNFGYTSSLNYEDYKTASSQIIEQQIKAGKPVILLGQGTGGHAWVCDGFRRFNTCTYSSVSLYMHWGWYDGKYDGWFTTTTWNPSSENNYYKDRKILYNIKP